MPRSTMQAGTVGEDRRPGEASPFARRRTGAVTVSRHARERTARLNRAVRFAVQIAFFALAPALFSGAFNGMKYLFSQMGESQPIELTSFVSLLLALVGFTVVFGRFFCGYACAFGTLGDVVHAAFSFVWAKAKLPRIIFPPRLVKALSLLKYAVLAGICLASFAGVWASVSGYSPWISFAGVISLSFDDIAIGAFVMLGFVIVGMAVRERFFCQFFCPLGAVFSLLPTLGCSSFTRTRAHCAPSCGRCQAACPVDIWPDGESMNRGECISCGRCADACPLGNVNLVAVERQPAVNAEASSAKPVCKTRDRWLLLRGTEPAVVVAKAAVLLALCWAVGATRYLPSFQEIADALSGVG